MTKTNEQIVAAQIAAYEAGKAWAESLKVGDVFTGAQPEAMSRYQDEHLIRMFTWAALDVFETMDRISTDMSGVLVEYRRKATQEAC